MSATLDLNSFLQSAEAALPSWIPEVTEQALLRLQTPGFSLGGNERRELLAVQAVLGRGQARGLAQAWEQALREHLHLRSSADQPVLAAEVAKTSAGAPADLSLLTLKDEQEVDEDIELSRLTQDLESRCESQLRDLRALCSALRAQTGVSADAPPLHPQVLAHTLGQAARSQPLSPAGRLLLLRACAQVATPVLQTVFTEQIRLLKTAGVQPARFRVQAAPEKLGRAHGSTSVESTDSATADGVIANQVPARQMRAVLQQLLASAGPGAQAAGQPAGAVSDAWMRAVLQAVQQEAVPAPSMRAVLERLTDPGMQLARAEPALWQQPEHVWWQLLDRLMALCEMLEAQPGERQEDAVQRCAAAVTRLCEGETLDSKLCESVLDDVNTVRRTLADAPRDVLPDDATVSSLQGPLVELVREQMNQQLRTSVAPSSLRRFLLGPWLRVLTAALDPDSGDKPRAGRYTQCVDALLQAARYCPSSAELDTLLAVVREGLSYIQLPEPQVDSWLFDITMRLHEVGHEVVQEDAADTVPPWKHEDLPTVPIDLYGSVHGARARRDRVAWIQNLRTGDLCRLSLDGQWLVAQLVVDPMAAGKSDEVYVFRSRSPKRLHSLTRAALVRLRSEGLATSIEQGSFIARALDTLAVRLDEPAPKSAP